MTTQRRTPQGYTGFVETAADTEMYAAPKPKPKDYKDPYRTNPELEATRERWETLYCNSLVPPPATPFNPVWPALWVVVIVGLCFIAAAG